MTLLFAALHKPACGHLADIILCPRSCLHSEVKRTSNTQRELFRFDPMQTYASSADVGCSV
jgi:hypothetical protein